MSEADVQLLQAWQDGEPGAGDELFARHFHSVFRFFRSKVDDALAEDLTQATFLGCMRGRDSLRDHGSFRTYLFVVARNELYLHFRRRGRQDKVLDFRSVSAADLATGPSSMLAAKEEQQLLLEALRLIPVDFQIAIELYYWEGLSTEELAEVQGIPAGTVRSRLTRAREQIGRRMQEIAASPRLAATTLEQFERWAKASGDVASSV